MASTIFDKFAGIFWAESFWFPKNVTWSGIISMRESGKMYLPLPRDLWAPFPLAVLLFVARLIWESWVALPVGRYMNISERLPRKVQQNAILEKAYVTYGKYQPKDHVILAIAKQGDWSVRHVERWWRRRRLQNKGTEMQRFKETSWRFMFYLVAFYCGLAVLWNKPYFWNTPHCWYELPWQPIPDEIYWYVMVELGFYWSLVISLFMDVKRKDFTEMIVHHIATIGLMMFSWSNGMVRMGTLVIFLHDAADYWMEAAKLAKYAKYEKLSDALFVVFIIVWFITRLVIYPLSILRSTMNEAHHILGMRPVYYLFNGFLITLQVLHILWSITITKITYLYIIQGKIEKDDRSETEPDTNSDDDLVLADKQYSRTIPDKATNGDRAQLENNNTDDMVSKCLHKKT